MPITPTFNNVTNVLARLAHLAEKARVYDASNVSRQGTTRQWEIPLATPHSPESRPCRQKVVSPLIPPKAMSPTMVETMKSRNQEGRRGATLTVVRRVEVMMEVTPPVTMMIQIA